MNMDQKKTMSQDLFNLLVGLRTQLLTILGGVKNSSGFNWDTTKNNLVIRSEVEKVLKQHLKGFERVGVYVFERYSDCGRASCASLSGADGYFWKSVEGKVIPYPNNKLVFYEVLESYELTYKCPCFTNNRKKKGNIIKEVVLGRAGDVATTQLLGDVVSGLYAAVLIAKSNKPRSAIREKLLLTILTINDLILPMTVDDYIELKGMKSIG